jgi:hypothetical protein
MPNEAQPHIKLRDRELTPMHANKSFAWIRVYLAGENQQSS